MRVLRAADRTAVPWKNGGGITREITGFPAGASAAGFEWRISLAEVATNGPFSEFPGVDRILTMVEGKGMALTLNGTAPRLVDARHVPQHFPGDVPTDCRLLEGPVANLNVMYRRGTDTTAHVEVVHGRFGPVTVPPHGSTVVVVALDAPVALPGAGLTLGPYDAVVCTEDPGALHTGGHTGGHTDGRAAVITVRHG
ncbi:HutD family protein [Streptomyces sp. NPDC048442]|uniref:HutD/Ves family protein n=1 Tax=Streptomyces sp. NPDC048442 TaxID=3154823 RepID=UPI00343D9B33